MKTPAEAIRDAQAAMVTLEHALHIEAVHKLPQAARDKVEKPL